MNELGAGGPDRPDILERVLAREHDSLHAEPLHEAGAGGVMNRELRGAVDFEVGIEVLDQPDRAQVLHQRGIDAAIDAFAQMEQRFAQLGRLEEDVEREIDARAALVRQPAGLLEVVERQLRAVVARVELLDAQVDGVRPVCQGGANSIEAPRWGEQFGNGAAHNARI